MAKDPVCGMQVDEKEAAANSAYKATPYYFCAPACQVTFEKNPEKFIGKAKAWPAHSRSSVCPRTGSEVQEVCEMRRRAVLIGVLLLSAGLLAGCPKRPEVAQAGPGAVGPGAAATPATPAPTPSPRAGDVPVARPAPPAEVPVTPGPPLGAAPSTTSAAVPLQDTFFDFDKSAIRDDQKATLSGSIAWLKANPAAKLTIGGHADERGTNEYNLALGERRAKATKDYLVAAGIDAARIATVSYGEERPFVLGHDESAWKWNRRAHFVVGPR